MILITLTLILIELASCGNNNTDEIKTLSVNVTYDYNNYIDGHVTSLLDGNSIWFDLEDYGIDTLVVGDELIIKYTGEYEVMEIYPGVVVKNEMNIQSIKVKENDIVEYLVSRVPKDDKIDLVPKDNQYCNYTLSNYVYVVSQDYTLKKYDQYLQNTTLYAQYLKLINQ